MQLALSSHSLFTLDTYQTFDMDSGYSYHLYNLEEDNLTEDNVDFDFDSLGYLRELASNQETFLQENCIDDIIKSYTLKKDSIYRPKYYNYTTDSAEYSIEFDARKLNRFIKDNQESFLEKYKSSHYERETAPESYGEKLEFYFETTYGKLDNDYIMYQYENVNDYEYISYTIKEKAPAPLTPLI
jgi:hypothetical protein